MIPFSRHSRNNPKKKQLLIGIGMRHVPAEELVRAEVLVFGFLQTVNALVEFARLVVDVLVFLFRARPQVGGETWGMEVDQALAAMSARGRSALWAGLS